MVRGRKSKSPGRIHWSGIKCFVFRERVDDPGTKEGREMLKETKIKQYQLEKKRIKLKKVPGPMRLVDIFVET